MPSPPVSSARAIDCDVHPTLSGLRALAPFLEPHWRESIEARGMETLESASYPPNAPITARADWREEGGGRAGTTLDGLQRQVLGRLGADFAILNPLFPVDEFIPRIEP